jgi:hypothetical protein
MYFRLRDITFFVSVRSLITFKVLPVDDGGQLTVDKNNYLTHTDTC